MENNLQNILAILNQNGGQYIDDHNRNTPGTDTAKAIAVHGRHVVLLFPKAQYFSINKLYICQGQVHLSTISVGGAIDLRNSNLEQAILAYNKDGAEYERSPIEQVTFIGATA